MTIPSGSYIFINIGLIALFVILIVFGFMKGFLRGLFSLLFTVGSILVAWFLSPVLASLFPLIKFTTPQPIEVSPVVNTMLYFVIVFIVIRLVFCLINPLLKNIKNIPVFGFLDQLLGAFFGFVNATIVSMFLAMLLTLPLFTNGSVVREKTFFRFVDKLAYDAFDYLNTHINFDYFVKKIEGFDVKNARIIVKDWLAKEASKITNE